MSMASVGPGRMTTRLITTSRDAASVQPRFYSVTDTAHILGVSEMTLYRAIRLGQFPAVRLMGRLIIPARAIDELIEAAIGDGALVDTEQWPPASGPGDAPDQLRKDSSGERSSRNQVAPYSGSSRR